MENTIDDVLDELEALIASGPGFSARVSEVADDGSNRSDTPNTSPALSNEQRARLAEIVAEQPEIVELLVAGFAAQSVALKFAETRLAEKKPEARRRQPADYETSAQTTFEDADEEGPRRGFWGWLLGPPPPRVARNPKANAEAVPAFDPIGDSSRENDVAVGRTDPNLQVGFRMAYAVGGGAILSYLLTQGATESATFAGGADETQAVFGDTDLKVAAKHDSSDEDASDADANPTETESAVDSDHH